MKKTKVGIVGCGMISDIYFEANHKFRNIEIIACCDVIKEKALAKEEKYNVKAMNYDELMNNKEVEIVLVLTPPLQHSQIELDALNHNKHVYTEKPFGVDAADANKVVELAKKKNLCLGSAPDTFMGGGYQTVRKLIDDNWIGKVLSGTAIVQGRGPEKWGQAPFFYDYGAGPMLDLGPYYITALVSLLGPAKSVVAVCSKGSEYRTLAGEVAEQYKDKYQPYGQYPVTINTHLTGIIEFVSGAIITVITSFDVYKHGHSPIELYGSEGSIMCPDPNTFGGPVKVFRNGMKDWENIPIPFPYTENSRGLGIADMALSMEEKRDYRANMNLANHVLEIMLSFDKSNAENKKIMLKSSCERPAPLSINGLYD